MIKIADGEARQLILEALISKAESINVLIRQKSDCGELNPAVADTLIKRKDKFLHLADELMEAVIDEAE